MFKILLFIGLLTSCGKIYNTNKQVNIEEEFQPYIDSFVNLSVDLNKPIIIDNLIVRYGNNPDNDKYLGVCITGLETPIIEINPNYWVNLNESEKEHVMFHELGHCVLNRGHDEGQLLLEDLGYYIPKSIMYPYIFSSNVYESNYDYYVNELFYNTKTIKNKENIITIKCE
jgi:hypothetical protein